MPKIGKFKKWGFCREIMEYNELQRLTYKTIGKAMATGLVGIVLTCGAVKAIKNPHKSGVGALGLGLTTLAMGYQFVRASKEYY